MMEVKTNKTFSYTYTTNGGAWPTLAHSLRIIIGKEKIKKGEKKERRGREVVEEGGGLEFLRDGVSLHYQLPLPRSLYIKPTFKRR